MAIREANRERLRALGNAAAHLPSEHLPDDLLKETRDAMRDAFADHGYSGKFYLSRTPGSSGSTRVEQEARWFLSTSRNVDPGDLVNQLDEFVARNEARLVRVAAIWGLHPDREVHLAEGYKLVPLASLETSHFRDTCMGDGPEPAKAKARAAIVHEFVHRPIFIHSPSEVAAFTWDDKYRLTDLCLVLGLLGDAPVVRVGECYQVKPGTPVLERDGGWGGTFTEPRISVEIPPQSYDERRAAEIVTGFLALSTADRKRMLVALRRLTRAGLHERPSDTAIDLGIAFEALLSEAGDPVDSITYRLKVRAALMLGGSIDERQATARKLTQLYGLRSHAAHGGADIDGHFRGAEIVKVGDHKYTASELHETLTEGRQLCGDIARRLLSRGGFPNYARMVLGEN